MAERYKSKYKTPKDFEKSQKPKLRKDLKDYTADDKKGGMNPRTTGDMQHNVLRKRDKQMQDEMMVNYIQHIMMMIVYIKILKMAIMIQRLLPND